MSQPLRSKHRRGIALTIAVAVMPLAVVAMTAMAMLVAADARRTHQRMIEAELDQLLLTGCLQVQSGATLDLPPELIAQGGTISISRNGDVMLISARFGGTERTAIIHTTPPLK